MFTDDYKKARTALTAKKLTFKLPNGAAPDIGSVFGVDGPSRANAPILDALRDGIKISVRTKNMSEGEVIVAACTDAAAGGLLAKIIPGDQTAKYAGVKIARHLYLIKTRGGQEIWVYAGPREFKKDVFAETKGLTGAPLATKLSAFDEVFSTSHRKDLGELVQTSLAWTMKATSKLGSPDKATLDIVRFWYGTGSTSDEDLKKICATLNDGFKKLTTVFNSNKLIFSDDAANRNLMNDPTDPSQGTGWDDYAFVNPSETLEVVYAQNAMLKAINTKKWLAVLTLIHEVSHRKLKTDDIRYDFKHHLSPSEGKITVAGAMKNADTWGYFAADINGALPAADKKSVGKK